ncbi:MAG: right-handed parallel beta-helix repeat-containing protein [Candidatus Aenigmarchaeota archaeon]|nr:right-handed parallel beta-helix repeat-containing protein [Candidatus Aenigmarchaeota archaeon]
MKTKIILFITVCIFLSAEIVFADTTDDLIFIHHSCGNNWLNQDLRNALLNKSYIDEVNEIYYNDVVSNDTGRPDSLDAFGGQEGDHTNMNHWIYWFNDYLESVKSYECDNGTNKIIMFKSCYPISDVVGNGTEPGSPFHATYSPNNQTIANYKAVYRHPNGSGKNYTNNSYTYKPLEDIFAENSDVLFIPVTAPSLEPCSTNNASAHLARIFNNWLKSEWLQNYTNQTGLNNVAVYDWFDLLAYLDDNETYPSQTKLSYRTSCGNSHPNAQANQDSTDDFAENESNFIDAAWNAFQNGQGTSYYVANDGNDSYQGNITHPWQTIEKVDTELSGVINQGDDIYFMRGDSWVSSVALNVDAGGNASNEMIFGAYGTGAKPNISRTGGNQIFYFDQNGMGHVTIQDLHFTGGDSTRVTFFYNGCNNHNITLRNIVSENTGPLFAGYNTKDVLIEDCVIDANGSHGISIQHDGSGSFQCGNFIIRNCSINDAKDGISIHYGGTNENNSIGDNFLIENCTIWDTWEEVIDIVGGYGCDNVLIRDCNLSDAGNLVTGHGQANVMIDNCYIHHMPGNAHTFTRAYNIRMRNSVIYSWGNNGIAKNENQYPPDESIGMYYYHNNIITDGDPDHIQINNKNISGLIFKNNIFHSTNDSSPNTFVHYISPANLSNTNSNFSYNIWWRGDGLNGNHWDGYNFTEWLSQPEVTGDMRTDPKMVDPANENFTLQSDSPAIDSGDWLTETVGSGSGTNITVEDAAYFHDGFGLTNGDLIKVGLNSVVMVTDINYTTDNITVNQSISWSNGDPVGLVYSGIAPDIGAYEYQGTTTTTSTITSTTTTLPGTFATHKVSSSHDNIYTMIRNSKGNVWSAESANIQVAINNLGSAGGTVWLPGVMKFNLTDTVIVKENVMLDLGGSSLKLPDGVKINMVELKNGAGIRNGAIDVAGHVTWYNTYTDFLEPNSCIFLNATSYIESALIENMALETIGLGYNNSVYRYFTIYFNSSTENSGWENTANLVDGSTSTYAQGNETDSIRLDGNTHDSSYEQGYYGPRNVTDVYLRAYVEHSNSSKNVTLTPRFANSSLGDVHLLSYVSSAGYTNWVEITDDTNAPSPWTWSELENLDCYVNVSAGPGFDAQVSIVQIMVNTDSPQRFYDPTYSGRGYGIHLYAPDIAVPQKITGVVVRDTYLRSFVNAILIQNERNPSGSEPGAHIDGNTFEYMWFYANEIGVNISRNTAVSRENCSTSGNVFNMIQFQTGTESWWGGEQITHRSIVADGYGNIFTNIMAWDPANIRHTDGRLCSDVLGYPCFRVEFTNDSENNYIIGRCGLSNDIDTYGKFSNKGKNNTRFDTSFGVLNISSVITKG